MWPEASFNTKSLNMFLKDCKLYICILINAIHPCVQNWLCHVISHALPVSFAQWTYFYQWGLHFKCPKYCPENSVSEAIAAHLRKTHIHNSVLVHCFPQICRCYRQWTVRHDLTPGRLHSWKIKYSMVDMIYLNKTNTSKHGTIASSWKFERFSPL